MKFVDKQQFYNLPENTLYSKFIPHRIEGLYIKGETIKSFENNTPIDYVYVSLIDNIDSRNSEEYLDILDKRSDFTLDYEGGSRDGMFDENEQFVIYDDNDIRKLTSTLQNILYVKENK